MITTWVKCRNTSAHGIVGFYLVISGTEYFLCAQKFRKGMWKFYRNGVPYNMAVDYSRAHNDFAIINAMTRIRSCVDYLERTENIYIPERNNKKPVNLKCRTSVLQEYKNI